MATNASYVTTGKPKVGGAVFVGATTATLPTDATTALTDFNDLGYCSEDGLVNANSPETDSIHAWGGDTVLDVQTEKADTFTFTLIEAMNVNVLKTVYGDDNVTGTLTTGIHVKATAEEPELHAYVIDMVLNGDVAKRVVVPSAKITEIGDIEYTDGDAVGYEVTISAYPDSTGVTHHEYILQS